MGLALRSSGFSNHGKDDGDWEGGGQGQGGSGEGNGPSQMLRVFKADGWRQEREAP